mmetsp:Transcript_15238/g.26920  ORF Transcript_15238/g.26920 Transcript_15238/m.26920 type:complete len:220 (+) Transcript_15238:13-672(+)
MDLNASSVNVENGAGNDRSDIFDVIHGIEQQWIQEGLTEGEQKGRDNGFSQGKAIGRTKGFELGYEIGFYKGFCEAWLTVDRMKAGFLNDRQKKTIIGLYQLSDSFQLRNDPSMNMGEDVQRLRAKFKVAVSLLKCKTRFEKKDVFALSHGNAGRQEVLLEDKIKHPTAAELEVGVVHCSSSDNGSGTSNKLPTTRNSIARPAASGGKFAHIDTSHLSF